MELLAWFGIGVAIVGIAAAATVGLTIAVFDYGWRALIGPTILAVLAWAVWGLWWLTEGRLQ